MGFSQKWGSSEHFCWNFLGPVGPAGEDKFYELVILKHPPLVFPQIAKIWISRKSKMTKVCFRTFPDLWRHAYTRLFCLILNLTYRTNETFSSRTHSFGSLFQTLVGGWLIKVLKMVKTMLRMKTLVWYPDGPRVVVSAHSVQFCDARPASPRSFVNNVNDVM